MIAALNLLRSVPGERIAVLGDMLELGPNEESAHRQVGAHAAAIVDGLVVRGPRAAWIAEGAAQAGLPQKRIEHTMTNHDAALAALSLLRVPVSSGSRHDPPTSSILVKGSRGMEMEDVVAELRGTR
jgi:UDP-N-acetylmuramoyl-tripeptide--D-alanyl-D-alanine ligase